MLAEKLLTLRELLIGMSTLAEVMIAQSIQGLQTKNPELFVDVLNKNEPRINDLEIEIEEFCINLIALFQPKARDARQILTAYKMASELERIGDHAVNIAQAGQFLIEQPPVKPLIDIPRMAALTIEMLKNSLNSYIKENIQLAQATLLKDDEVDALRDQVTRDLIACMTTDPETIARGVGLIRIAANLERAADLSTNICEEVIYMVQGRVVKHHYEERRIQEQNIKNAKS